MSFEQFFDKFSRTILTGSAVIFFGWVILATFFSEPSGEYHLRAVHSGTGIVGAQVREHIPFFWDRNIFTGTATEAGKIYLFLRRMETPVAPKPLLPRETVQL